MSHGWKESEYHPFSYKVNICTGRPCLKGRDCPNYH